MLVFVVELLQDPQQIATSALKRFDLLDKVHSDLAPALYFSPATGFASFIACLHKMSRDARRL